MQVHSDLAKKSLIRYFPNICFCPQVKTGLPTILFPDLKLTATGNFKLNIIKIFENSKFFSNFLMCWICSCEFFGISSTCMLSEAE